MQIAVNVPDGQSGIWKVETFEVSPQQESLSRIRSSWRPEEFVRAGTYKRLTRGGTVVMSNTPMEIQTNRYFMSVATGSVLINGLGLGMVLTKILEKRQVRDVTDVTVIEDSIDVISLVAPTFESDPRVKIIHADAFTWEPPRGKRYDYVWHDIWDDLCGDNLPEMKRLTRKYGRRCEWQGCWAREILERGRR